MTDLILASNINLQLLQPASNIFLTAWFTLIVTNQLEEREVWDVILLSDCRVLLVW